MVKMAKYTDKYNSIKLTRFYMKVVGFWYPETQREKWILHATLTYTVAAVIFGICVEVTDLYYSWGDFSAVTENVCVTMPLLVIIFKVVVFIIRRDVVIDLITFSEKNFWSASYDDFGELIMKQCERRGVILLYTLSASVQGTVASYVTAPMIGNIGKNETDRLLPFRLWIDLPTKVTPYYEIIYVIQVKFFCYLVVCFQSDFSRFAQVLMQVTVGRFIETLSTIHSGICFFCFDNMMGILNIHVVGQFKILQHRLEKLCDKITHDEIFGVDMLRETEEECSEIARQKQYRDPEEDTYNELRNCVKQHLVLIEYVQKLETVFSYILLCQMGVSSLFMCFGGFQLFAAKRATFVFQLTAAFSQLLLFTWTCNEIIIHSTEVAKACYRAKWYLMPNTKIGLSIRRGLMMVMIRARKACFISAGKFFPISLNAFMNILSTTASYYTLLRQVSEEQK